MKKKIIITNIDWNQNLIGYEIYRNKYSLWHIYIVLVQVFLHLFTCHTTQALIKCPLFLIIFDLIYPTFIFYLYYLFFKKLDKWEWTVYLISNPVIP
jgi:hypothetical protein